MTEPRRDGDAVRDAAAMGAFGVPSRYLDEAAEIYGFDGGMPDPVSLDPRQCDLIERIATALVARDAALREARAELEVQALYQEAQQLGRATERAAIVAWLYRQEVAEKEIREALVEGLTSAQDLAEEVSFGLAEAIGRGEHAHRGEREPG